MRRSRTSTPDSVEFRDITLTPRQHAVLGHLLAGAGEKQIASLLGRSRHTIHRHITALYRRMGVSGRAELMARFIRSPWNTEPSGPVPAISPAALAED